MKPKPCKYCGSTLHFPFQCFKNPKYGKKKINRESKKQKSYNSWLKNTARPHLEERDGLYCGCCGIYSERLDIDHIVSKGSRPDLKMELSNLQFLCRFPCHRNKTDNIECIH